MTLDSQIYRLSVKNLNLEKEWVITRKYQDFMWLFAVPVPLPRP
jgi:hypothetical protein